METAGRLLLGAAAVLALVGLALLGLSKLGLDRLPGDVVIRRGNLPFYDPLGLMILVSLVLSIILTVVSRR